jgi:hypothetical protein
MSTLATTNIKHPSSASNNIVLDSAGGVDLDALTVSGSAPADSVNIDASGKLLVGTSATDTVGVGSGGAQLQSVAANPFSAARFSNDAFGCVVAIGKSRGASAGSYTVVQNNDILGEIRFAGADGTDLQTVGAQINAEVDGTPGANDLPTRLVCSTTADGASSPTERMRITNQGAVSIGTTGNPGISTFGIAFGRAGNTGLIEQSRNVSGSSVAAAFGGNAGLVYVMGDGDLENTNNRYTGISDIKFKQNIGDASSQWDDIKSIQVRKYELIANPDRKHIGCVAQELEQVCPGLVIEREDRKRRAAVQGVKAGTLPYMLSKALQEAMERIETLEAEVAALKAP